MLGSPSAPRPSDYLTEPSPLPVRQALLLSPFLQMKILRLKVSEARGDANEDTERHSTPLVTRERQVKTTVRSLHTP